MNRFAVTSILVVVTTALAMSDRQPTNATNAELVGVVQALADAQRTFDQAAMNRLLADDYVEVSPVGEVDPRAKVLGFYTPEARDKAPQLRSVQVDEPNVRIYGDQAIVIVRQTMNVEAGATTRAVAMRVLMHLRRLEGRWRVASAQFTPIMPSRRAG